MNDLRIAFRMLRRTPGFSLVAILSIALGIGGNTGIFTIANTIFFRPLPGIQEPGSLASVFQTLKDRSDAYSKMSFLDYQDLEAQSSLFSGLAAHGIRSVTLTGSGGLVERIPVEVTTPNFFSVLGVQAALGRTFLLTDPAGAAESHVVVLSHKLWQTRFGGDADIVGKSVRLNGKSFVVIGVAQQDFFGMELGRRAEAWIAMPAFPDVSTSGEASLHTRDSRWLFVVGRLKPGASIAEARAECRVVGDRLAQTHPDTNENLSFAPVSLRRSGVHPELRVPAMGVVGFLMGIAGLVLLIACVNVANLLLGRGVARSKELAIRMSLGASRASLVRHLMAECILIGLAGGCLGVIIADWISRLLMAFRAPVFGSLALDLRLDVRVLAFTLGLSLLTALLFGLVPSFRATRIRLVTALNEVVPGVRLGRRRFSLRNVCIVSQVFLSVILLMICAVFLRSLRAAYSADPGFNPKEVLLLAMDFGERGYSDTQVESFCTRLRERVMAQPGVGAVSWASAVPLGAKTSQTSGLSDEQWSRRQTEGEQVFCNAVDTGYFALMEIPLRQGRNLTSQDDARAQPVVVVSEHTAQHFWPGQNPIGKGLHLGGTERPLEVIGVVGNTKAQDIREKPQLQAYQPLAQQPQDALVFHVRAPQVESLAHPVQALIGELDAQLPVHDVETLGQHTNRSFFLHRIIASLALIFAGLALVLAAGGIYGVVNYALSRRIREIGIRMAVGADRKQVLLMVLGQGARVAGLGILLGLLPAAAITKLLSGFLVQIHFFDPISFVGVPLILLGVASAAALPPALRAMRLEPMEALRYE